MLGFQRLNWGDEFPFSVPAIATIERLELGQSVTLLAGDNGSGKSTILEAIAAAIGFAKQGGELARRGELPAVPRNVLDDVRAPLLAPVLSATKPCAATPASDSLANALDIYGNVPGKSRPWWQAGLEAHEGEALRRDRRRV